MKRDDAMISTDIWLPQMQQQIFRGLLDAFSYPGRISTGADQSTPAWLATLSALVDGESTLADPQQLLSAEWWPKLEARRAPPDRAAFILLNASHAPELIPNLGTLEAPETGATLLLRVNSLHSDLTGDVHLGLTGPGIRQQVSISVSGLHPAWITSRNEWVSAFPRGVEMVLCDAHNYMALPRTTQIVMGVAA